MIPGEPTVATGLSGRVRRSPKRGKHPTNKWPTKVVCSKWEDVWYFFPNKNSAKVEQDKCKLKMPLLLIFFCENLFRTCVLLKADWPPRQWKQQWVTKLLESKMALRQCVCVYKVLLLWLVNVTRSQSFSKWTFYINSWISTLNFPIWISTTLLLYFVRRVKFIIFLTSVQSVQVALPQFFSWPDPSQNTSQRTFQHTPGTPRPKKTTVYERIPFNLRVWGGLLCSKGYVGVLF